MTFTRISGSSRTGKRNKLSSLFTNRETIRVYSGDSVTSSKAKRRSIRLATIKRIKDNVGKFRGKLANGARTDDRKPKLSGTLSSRLKDGQKLRIYASRKSNGKAKLLGIAKVKGKKWSFTPAKKLASNRRYIFKAQVTDAKGKKLGRASKTRTLILDSKKPKLKITDNITGIATDAVTFTFTFSEKVKGFKKSDIRISGGTAGTFTKVNGRVYTLLVSPTDNAVGSIVAAVGKKKARDRAGNGNKAQKSSSQAFDTKAPSLTITDNTSGSARSEVLFTFTFSEAVSGFSVDDIKITGGSKGTFSKISDSVYTLLVSPTNNARETITVDVAAKVASDVAGNNNTAAVQATQVFDSRTSIELSDVAEGKGGFVIHGEEEGDLSGSSVSSAGDVNGDGFDDLIIGAAYADSSNGSNSGKAYVVFGKAVNNSPIKLSEIANGNGGFVINGESAGDHSGYSVSSAGDINGDGFTDLIIGAPDAMPHEITSAGSSYIVFGKALHNSPINLQEIVNSDGGFVVNGESDDDEVGFSVSSAGDINGDGLDDLIIGAQGKNDATGSTYVVFGKEAYNSPIQISDIADGNGGFVINGESAWERSGYSVSSAGDINGDGVDDLIIGAYGADPNGDHCGRTYVVFGQKQLNSPIQLSEIAASKAGFVIDGEAEYDLSGISVSSAGDVNGDDLADLVIGAPYADPNGKMEAGSSYVVFGRKGNYSSIQLSDVASGAGGFVIHGKSASDYSGYSVSSAGDVNGDGFDDLIIGAYGADPNEIRDAGRSYIVFGKKGNNVAVQLSDIAAGTGGFVINGQSAYDYSGRSVSSAGDFNGDGFADLIIGAYGSDANGDKSGSTYVIL